MNRPKRMLVENVAWAAEQSDADPDCFDNLLKGQSPKVLWLGCSDSRVARRVRHELESWRPVRSSQHRQSVSHPTTTTP